jgi:hypothetical protein
MIELSAKLLIAAVIVLGISAPIPVIQGAGLAP